MKKLLKKLDARLLIIVAALALSTTVDANVFSHSRNNHCRPKPPKCVHKQKPPCKTVGAPLDSGLLTVMLGAGALFFVTRKKQKEQ